MINQCSPSYVQTKQLIIKYLSSCNYKCQSTYLINPDVSKIEIPAILNYILPQYLTSYTPYLDPLLIVINKCSYGDKQVDLYLGGLIFGEGVYSGGGLIFGGRAYIWNGVNVSNVMRFMVFIYCGYIYAAINVKPQGRGRTYVECLIDFCFLTLWNLIDTISRGWGYLI